MISREIAKRIAGDWIDSWNSRNLDSIMSRYSEDVELISPIVIKLLGDKSGTVRGRDALREYFGNGLSAFPDLGFEMIEVFTGVDSFVLYYKWRNGPPRAGMTVLDREDKSIGSSPITTMQNEREHKINPK